jgi:hypothetical protein
MPLVRRARGALLRLVRRRMAAAIVGLMLAGPAAWVQFSGREYAWWLHGVALVAGAVGVALLWTGLAGLTPDWIDES